MKSDCGVAADLASHFYEDIRDDRPSSIVDHLPSMYWVFDRIRELADAVELIVLGHVPAVLERFPAAAPDLIASPYGSPDRIPALLCSGRSVDFLGLP
jgi:hypothetical protein